MGFTNRARAERAPRLRESAGGPDPTDAEPARLRPSATPKTEMSWPSDDSLRSGYEPRCVEPRTAMAEKLYDAWSGSMRFIVKGEACQALRRDGINRLTSLLENEERMKAEIAARKEPEKEDRLFMSPLKNIVE